MNPPARLEFSDDFGEVDEEEDDDDEVNALGLSVIREGGAQSSTFPAPAVKNLAIYYLQTELKLSEATLMNVILKYSWVMYLRVETNLKPTVEVLRSFGFKVHHIRDMVSVVPSILAINHNWTLPEKLLSIQKMFELSRAQLVRLCVQQPLLLTSSIDRNLAVSAFLRDARAGVGLSAEQMRTLLQASPTLAMTGLPTLKVCWSVLTTTYGLAPREARALVMKCPQLLSRRLLLNGRDKLAFFADELGTPVAEPEARRLVARCPALLYLDTDVFLRPNVAVLRQYLGLRDAADLQQVLGVFPQLLGCNPASLERQCAGALWLLTGDREYAEAAAALGAGASRQGDAGLFGGGDDDDDEDGLLGEGEGMGVGVEEDEEEDEEDEDEDDGSSGGALTSYFLTADDDSRERRTVPPSLREAVAELALGGAADRGLDLIGDLLRSTDAEAGVAAAGLRARARAGAEAGAGTGAGAGAGGMAGGGRRRLLRALAGAGGQGGGSHTPTPAPAPSAASGAYGVAMEIEATRLMLQACSSLALPRPRALAVARAAPWILSYRPERSKRVLGALAVSLGMCREELTRCVAMYPRLLSLSVDAKLSAVLRSLTRAASKIYLQSIRDDEEAEAAAAVAAAVAAVKASGSRSGSGSGSGSGSAAPARASSSLLRKCHDAKSLLAAAEGEAALAADLEAALAEERGDGVTIYSVAAYEHGLAVLYARRRHTIRSMVRAAVLRYPLILGTSMERIDGRLDEVHSGAADIPWPEIVNFIRRDAGAHERWKGRKEGRQEEEEAALERAARAEQRRHSSALKKQQAELLRVEKENIKLVAAAVAAAVALEGAEAGTAPQPRARGRPRKAKAEAVAEAEAAGAVVGVGEE